MNKNTEPAISCNRAVDEFHTILQLSFGDMAVVLLKVASSKTDAKISVLF